MSKKKLSYIVCLMIIALIALIAIQYRFIRDSYQQKEQLFDQSVQAILSELANKVEKEEARKFILAKANAQPKRRIVTRSIVAAESPGALRKPRRTQSAAGGETDGQDVQEIYALEFAVAPSLEQMQASQQRAQKLGDSMARAMSGYTEEVRKSNRALQRLAALNRANIYRISSDSLRIRIDTSFEQLLGPAIVEHYPASPPGFPPPPAAPIAPSSIARDAHNRARRAMREAAEQEYLAKIRKDKVEILEELVSEMEILNVPLQQRFSNGAIDSLLQYELLKNNITLPYTLRIKSTNNQVFYEAGLRDSSMNPSAYEVKLFDEGFEKEAAVIQVSFPQKHRSLMMATAPALGASMLLYLFIVAAFAYTLNAILRQKKLATLKNDFINNMTHEFKTPVSTILLASEALKEPTAIEDPARVKRLAGIIYDENLRLNEHVERVLHMARMEKGDVKLQLQQLHLHEAIEEIVSFMQLNLQSKNQEISLNLAAADDVIAADLFHLKNVIQNLLDNASKYSKENTSIHISTQMENGIVQMRIEDQGIGMKKEQLTKIFDPFYRVPTGNLHDVKGFGIGLHYVCTILKLMQGKISVQSEWQKGTTFTITFNKGNQ